jgi:hypothetical protein
VAQPGYEWAGGEPVADLTDWELVVESRVRRARDDLARLTGQPQFKQSAEQALDVVDSVLSHRPRLISRLSTWWTGWRVERAWRALHEAEVYLTAADPDLEARLPALRERVASALPTTDLRRKAIIELSCDNPPSTANRAVVVDVVRAAFDASDEVHAAARALRNKLFVAAVVLVGVNTLLGIMGFVRPGFLPMCVERADLPGRLVCSSGGTAPFPADVWLVQVMGAAGAVVSTVVLLVRRRPTLSPYILIGYQALIKVLLGALLAVFGVLALGAGVGEGLIGVRGQAALLIAAVVFGYGQQIGTRLLDNYADHMLDRVRPLPQLGDSQV